MTLTIGQILFVGQDQDDGVLHLAIVDDPTQLLPALVNPISVGAVNNKY